MACRTVAHQAPLSMEFPRQEYWSGLLFPFSGNLLEPVSSALRQILYTVPTGTLGWWCPLKKWNPNNWAPYSWETSRRVEQGIQTFEHGWSPRSTESFLQLLYSFDSDGKESACNAGDVRDAGLIPGLGRSPGGGNGNPFQYSCLENPMDRGIWRTAVHRITKSRIRMKQPSMHTPAYLELIKFTYHRSYSYNSSKYAIILPIFLYPVSNDVQILLDALLKSKYSLCFASP